tara:strand:- start:557 stop:682 length:126 start_codon:yes stop_codon:yes gene_type:complete
MGTKAPIIRKGKPFTGHEKVNKKIDIKTSKKLRNIFCIIAM